jgi:hypothetical protein
MATMVMTPQKRPPALETCFDLPFAVVCDTTVWVGVGTTAGVLISSPGMTSGASNADDGRVRRER